MNKSVFIVILLGMMLLVIAGCSSAVTSAVTTVPAPSVAGQIVPSESAATEPSTEATISAPATTSPGIPKPEEIRMYKIADVLKDSKTLIGKSVIIEGKIVNECGAGCWFTLNDGTGTIYVDLAPSNLTIPQKRGAKARVYGTVTSEKGETYLIGTKVEF